MELWLGLDMSTIDGINNNWSSKAAAMDASTRVPHDAPFIAMWLDEDGKIHWSKSNMTITAESTIATYLNAMAMEWALKNMESN
jgi:hypothetical protein